MPAPTRIGIAVVEHDGRFLVGERGPEGPLAGYAEFPGGKCLLGESSDAAACRECREETGLAVTAVELLDERVFSYTHGDVQLSFWRCRLNGPGEGKPLHGFSWVSRSMLRELTLPEGNRAVLDKLLAAVSDAPI